MTRPWPPRAASPAPDGLRALEAELHAARGTADTEALEALADYVAGHPGASAKDVILHRAPGLSYRQAEFALRDLLADGLLRSDPDGCAFHAPIPATGPAEDS